MLPLRCDNWDFKNNDAVFTDYRIALGIGHELEQFGCGVDEKCKFLWYGSI